MTFGWVMVALAYALAFIPALRTAVAFWLYRDKDETAKHAMRRGFFMGFISIWFIYPFYLIKNCFYK